MPVEVTQEHFERYHALSTEALRIAQEAEITNAESAQEIFSMVENYLSDARYFSEQGDLVRAFAAVNYAHGWLDCGARMKFYIVTNNHYFTEDGEN